MHVREFRKRGNKLKIGDNENILSDSDTQKNDIFEELKNIKHNDLEYDIRIPINI